MTPTFISQWVKPSGRIRRATHWAFIALISSLASHVAAAEALHDPKTEQRTVSFSDCRSWYYETYPLLFPHFEGEEQVHDHPWCRAFHKTLMQSDEWRPDVLDELLDNPADYCRRIRLKFIDKLPKIGRPKPSTDQRKSKTCEESTAEYQIMVAHCSKEAISLLDESFTTCLEREAVETHEFEFLDLQTLRYDLVLWKAGFDQLSFWSQRLLNNGVALTCADRVSFSDQRPMCMR